MNNLIQIIIIGIIFYCNIVDTEVSDKSREKFHVIQESKHDL